MKAASSTNLGAGSKLEFYQPEHLAKWPSGNDSTDTFEYKIRTVADGHYGIHFYKEVRKELEFTIL